MLITKRRTTYTIKCTHSDFAMLDALVEATPVDARRRVCKGYARTALTRRTKNGGSILRVDRDRSKRS